MERVNDREIVAGTRREISDRCHSKANRFSLSRLAIERTFARNF
jgi:hypothetical protein